MRNSGVNQSNSSSLSSGPAGMGRISGREADVSSSSSPKKRRSRGFRRVLVPALILAAGCAPSCRPKSGTGPVVFRLIDGLTNAGVLESPVKAVGAGAPDERAYPVDSAVLTESGIGEHAFGLKRKLALALLSRDILFAPPRSELRYRLPFKTEGVLDFGIGIVHDVHSAALLAAAGSPKDGVKFQIILENAGRETLLYERLLKQPEAQESRTINQVWERIPVSARAGKAGLKLVTTGPPGVFSYWSQPVLYVPEKAPLNIVLISIDTLRADHVGAYGYDRPLTPRIDALAADGVVFENAYSSSPWTLPAHVSMFTGLNCIRHRVYAERDQMDPRVPTLAERLRARGYATRAITGGGFVSPIYGFAKGFDEYHLDQADIMDASQAAKAGDDATRWIEKNGDRSFFLFLHTYQVHSPYKSPMPYRTMFLRPDARWSQVDINEIFGGASGIYAELSEPDRHNVIALYDAGIRFTDETLVQPVVDTLRKLNLYDRTMIIVTSDHGEEFFDHGGWNHSHSVYDELIRVPLVVKMPDSKFRGERFSPIVRLTDLMPTILDFAGIPYGDLSLNGESLRPVLGGKETADRVFLAELSGNVLNCQIPQRLAMNDGRTKIILNRPFSPEGLAFFTAGPPGFPAVELYDLAIDPGEETNIFDRPEDPARVRALVQKARENDRLIPLRGEGKRSLMDQRLEEQLRTLGYIQ